MKNSNNQQQVTTSEFLPFVREIFSQNDGPTSIRMTVTGRSMMPLLRDRTDSVVLTNEFAPKKYDIVFFTRDGGEAVLHRIVKIKPEGYWIVGDNERFCEGPIAPSQIIAVVKGFYRDGRYVPRERLWYRLYTVLWSKLLPLRRQLLKPALLCGKIIKRIERMGTEHEVDC